MFKNFVKKNWLSLVVCILGLAEALFWLAMRIVWAGISKVLGAENNPSFFVMESPLLICILLWMFFVYTVLILIFWSKSKIQKIVSLSLLSTFFILISVIVLMGATDYLEFILPKFLASFCVSLLLAAFASLLFFPPVGKCKKCKISKCVLLSLVIVAAVFLGYGVEINYITHEAVVYAVEDNYQIVFSTNRNSLAWVEIDGKEYFDLNAGSMRSTEVIHKIEVPQSVLDGAGEYSIFAQAAIFRGPYGGYKGRLLTKSYNFRGVDISDGLKYYSISDVHGAVKGAVNAAAYDEDLDFLILAGDISSMVETHYDANIVNVLAHKVTKGEYPVVYARGNHETKGSFAEQFHKYVGSKNGDFFYTVEFADVFGIVLDLGEDHEDNWWEYYGTAQFDVYRDRQTEFLSGINPANLSEYNYKFVAVHIPLVFVNNRLNHESYKNEWTAILNGLNIDMVISGHQHDLYPLLAGAASVNSTPLTYNAEFSGSAGKTYGGYLTDANFHNFLVSRRAESQIGAAQTSGKGKFIGLYTVVDFVAGRQTMIYTNAKKEKVSVVHPFAEINYGTDITTTLKSN